VRAGAAGKRGLHIWHGESDGDMALAA